MTTEKDAVRLPPEWAAEPRLAVVRIEAEVVAGAGVYRWCWTPRWPPAIGRGRRTQP